MPPEAFASEPTAADEGAPTLETTLRDLSDISGWLTDGQASRLWSCAGRVQPGGRIVEIGSFHGRSTVVLARGAQCGAEVVAIDPHGGGDRGPQELAADQARGDADADAFHATLRATGVEDRVRHVRLSSADAHAQVPGEVDLLYVDGAHRFRPALDDIRSWGARVTPGGTMLVHDSFSSIGVTLALLATTVSGTDWLYIGRERSLAEFRRVTMSGTTRRSNAAMQLRNLGWFARNVAVKISIVARAPGLARRLGDGSGEWPY